MAMNDVVQARMVCQWHGQTTITQFYYLAVTGPGNVPSLLGRLQTGVVNTFVPLMSSEITVIRLEGQRASPKPLTFLSLLAINQPGTVSGQSVVSSVSLVISKHTQYAGPSYRGRFFWPGLPQASESQSQLTNAAWTPWQTAANNLAAVLTDTDGTQWQPVLSHGYAPNTGVLTYTLITQCIVSLILRNQRRRQIGKGK